MPRLASNHQKLAMRHRTDPPSEPPEGIDSASPWSGTSRLQNCERIKSSCIKAPSLWYLVVAATGHRDTWTDSLFTFYLSQRHPSETVDRYTSRSTSGSQQSASQENNASSQWKGVTNVPSSIPAKQQLGFSASETPRPEQGISVWPLNSNISPVQSLMIKHWESSFRSQAFPPGVSLMRDSYGWR